MPMVYIVLASFIDPVTLQNTGLSLDFSKWTTTAYERVLSNAQIWVGFRNAIIYSVLFTIISVAVTLLAAYPMSRSDFRVESSSTSLYDHDVFRRRSHPDLLAYQQSWHARYHLGDSASWRVQRVEYDHPARTYYQGIRRSSGGSRNRRRNEIVYFFRGLLPVCTPIIATIAMWQFVGMWNSYFDAMIYLSSASKQPLQLVLRSILIQNQPEAGMVSDLQSTAARAQLAELLKYATIHHLEYSAFDHVSLLPEVFRQRNYGRRREGLSLHWAVSLLVS